MSFRGIRTCVALLACLALAGCTPSGGPTAQTSSPKSSPTAASSTPAPDSDRLVLTADGIAYVHSGTRVERPFSDSEGIIALVEKAMDSSPTVAKMEDPPGYEFNMSSYDWDGITIVANEDTSSVSVTSSPVHGVRIETSQGVSIGSSRADVLSKQGEAIGADDSATASDLQVDSHEVAGTDSLVHPGTTGITYVMVILKGETVRQLQSPADDFSDL